MPIAVAIVAIIAGQAPPSTAQVSTPSAEQGVALELMCFGAGAANKPDTRTVYGQESGTINSYGRRIGSYDGSFGATVTGTRSQGFEDQVSLRLNGGDGELRMPRTMLPIVRGGNDGWFKLKNIQYKSNEITASVAVNIINNPKLRLDRYTGAISISGKAGDYSGRCQAFDPARERRAF